MEPEQNESSHGIGNLFFVFNVSEPCFLCGGQQIIAVYSGEKHKRKMLIGFPMCVSCVSMYPSKIKGSTSLYTLPLNKMEYDLLAKVKYEKKELGSLEQISFMEIENNAEYFFNEKFKENTKKYIEQFVSFTQESKTCVFCDGKIEKIFRAQNYWICPNCRASIPQKPLHMKNFLDENGEEKKQKMAEELATEKEYSISLDEELYQKYIEDVLFIQTYLGFVNKNLKGTIRII